MRLIKLLLIIFFLQCLQVSANQDCNDNIILTTPDIRFSDDGDGTVTDKQTNLIWMRCTLGQSWDGSTCNGEADEYSWQQALVIAEDYSFAGSSNWRLPNVKELSSIVEPYCSEPSINISIFPQTSWYYWSSSPYKPESGVAWGVSFLDGTVYPYYTHVEYYVRLVRSGGY